MISALPQRIFAWCVRTEGSSRSSALIRIGLPLIIWARWGSEVLLFRSLESPAHTLLCVSFFASTTLMLLGVFSRASAAWAGLTFGSGAVGLGVVALLFILVLLRRRFQKVLNHFLELRVVARRFVGFAHL